MIFLFINFNMSFILRHALLEDCKTKYTTNFTKTPHLDDSKGEEKYRSASLLRGKNFLKTKQNVDLTKTFMSLLVPTLSSYFYSKQEKKS